MTDKPKSMTRLEAIIDALAEIAGRNRGVIPGEAAYVAVTRILSAEPPEDEIRIAADACTRVYPSPKIQAKAALLTVFPQQEKL